MPPHCPGGAVPRYVIVTNYVGNVNHGYRMAQPIVFTSTRPFDHFFENPKTPYNCVIHTASSLKFDVSDIRKEMIESAEKG